MATTKVDVNLIDASGITSSKFLKGDGTWDTVAVSAGFAGIHTDVSSGSEVYTVPSIAAGDPADITKLLVFITGGGGGGANGSVAVENGTGGGAAGTVIASVTVVATDTITIAIGAGGSAGSAGGNSTFTHTSGSGSFDTITAPGGVVGVLGSSPAAPTAPTVGASNDGIAIKGGWPGLWVANGEYGGDSFWGGGGMSPYLNNTAGKSADAFGAGGSGGDHGASTSTAGSGAVGVCLIMEFK